jgi:hypothetical protein
MDAAKERQLYNSKQIFFKSDIENNSKQGFYKKNFFCKEEIAYKLALIFQ